MIYNFAELKKHIQAKEDWLTKEFGSIRTSRANPSILDGVHVEAYGASVPINQAAGITNEDPRTIRITPWDHSLVKAIEKAITVANLGVSVSVDEKGVRVTFPELTGDRRTEIVKMAKEKFEQARIQIRKHRDDTNADIDKKEKEGGMGEDEKFAFKKEMQKTVDEANKKLQTMMEKKEKEILS